jgi:NRPS condensation-like uncharacterized protein
MNVKIVSSDDTIRPMPFEFMQSFYRQAHNPIIRAYFDFDGHLNVPMLKRAAKKTAECIPLLDCAYDDVRHTWVRQESDEDDFVDVISCNGSAMVEKYMLQPLCQDAGPRICLRILRYKEHDSLCVVFDHMVADGAGFKVCFSRIASTYSALLNQTHTVLYDGYTQRRDFGQVTESLSNLDKLNIMRSSNVHPKPDPAMCLPLSGQGDPHLMRVQISSEDFIHVHASIKRRGVTINDALLASYAYALHKATGCFNIVLPCPVDLRMFAPKAPCLRVANLTGSYVCTVSITDDQSMDDVLHAVSCAMRKEKSSTACLKGPILLHAAAHIVPVSVLSRVFFAYAGIPVISYTNVGIVNSDMTSFAGVHCKDAYIATAVKHPPSFQVSVSTFQNIVTLSSCLYASKEDYVYVMSFLESIKRYFIGLC